MTERRELSPIKQIAEVRGIRHTWLAAQLGVKPDYFNHIEAGRMKAPRGYYERAAQVLGVPVRLLLPPASTEPDREPEPEPTAA
jgi:transcriptional regulator with XRE-family HTH domain